MQCAQAAKLPSEKHGRTLGSTFPATFSIDESRPLLCGVGCLSQDLQTITAESNYDYDSQGPSYRPGNAKQ